MGVFFVQKPETLAATITVSAGQSIQSAVNSAVAGDVIQVRGGTYYERVTVSKSGTASAPIKIIGYPGEKPVIDGQDLRGEGVKISGSYVTVENLKVVNHNDDDIHIDRAANVILDGLEVHITGRAIKIENSSNVVVRNCKITTPAYIARQTDGIYSQQNKNNVYENNNIVISNSHDAGHDDAIQMYKDDSIVVRNNYLAQATDKTHNAQGLYATTMYGTSKFYNNVVNLGNARSNALTFRRLPELGGTGNVEIVGNTVVGLRLGHGIWVTEANNAIVKNNLVSPGTGVALTLSASGSGVSNNLVLADPRFVSVSSLDFHLQSNSPAIGAGVAMSAPYNVDKDGKSRPQGGSWEVGAYEYGGSAASPVLIRGVSPTIKPSTGSGDANGDGKVNLADFAIWKREHLKKVNTKTADFNSDGKVDLGDFQLWILSYLGKS